jgi:hypothetical protein
VHCVQNTHGAEFAQSFDTSRIAHLFHKGTGPRIDSYSTFSDNAHRRHTGFAHFLEKHEIKEHLPDRPRFGLLRKVQRARRAATRIEHAGWMAAAELNSSRATSSEQLGK